MKTKSMRMCVLSVCVMCVISKVKRGDSPVGGGGGRRRQLLLVLSTSFPPSLLSPCLPPSMTNKTKTLCLLLLCLSMCLGVYVCVWYGYHPRSNNKKTNIYMSHQRWPHNQRHKQHNKQREGKTGKKGQRNHGRRKKSSCSVCFVCLFALFFNKLTDIMYIHTLLLSSPCAGFYFLSFILQRGVRWRLSQC